MSEVQRSGKVPARPHLGCKWRAGSSGHAAEVGHITIVVDGRECRGGRWGCLKAHVGGWAIPPRLVGETGHEPGVGLMGIAIRFNPHRVVPGRRAPRRK